MQVPLSRVRALNDAPLLAGAYVLYWQTAARRTAHNFGLQHAIHHANLLGKPLLVLEALQVNYPFASERLHKLMLDGMAENRVIFAQHGVQHFAYVEPRPAAARGLLLALAQHAAVVVTDDAPQGFLPRMVQAAAQKLPVRLEAVDSVGLLPRSVAGRSFATAHAFRTFLQRALPPELEQFPQAQPLAALQVRVPVALDAAILARWPQATAEVLAGRTLGQLPIDHTVLPPATRGGARAADALLAAFVATRLTRYPEDRNHPDRDGASGLSPYLHTGHLSPHAVFLALAAAEDWHPGRLGVPNRGARTGWWGLSAAAEAFVDQLVTWRELGHLEAAFTPRYDEFATLPAWAQRTLQAHAHDPRPVLYTPEQLETAQTHDPLWNAAQRQLVQDGRMHNYLRMLWGKQILAWSPSPEDALAVMLRLNDRYALDGRDPNSVAGIQWVLGRYDRPWGPERPIFGTVRYMTSANTARKLETRQFVARYPTQSQLPLRAALPA